VRDQIVGAEQHRPVGVASQSGDVVQLGRQVAAGGPFDHRRSGRAQGRRQVVGEPGRLGRLEGVAGTGAEKGQRHRNLTACLLRTRPPFSRGHGGSG
jgi:hypothetical protein